MTGAPRAFTPIQLQAEIAVPRPDVSTAGAARCDDGVPTGRLDEMCCSADLGVPSQPCLTTSNREARGVRPPTPGQGGCTPDSNEAVPSAARDLAWIGSQLLVQIRW